jgi:hypothetical protein
LALQDVGDVVDVVDMAAVEVVVDAEVAVAVEAGADREIGKAFRMNLRQWNRSLSVTGQGHVGPLGFRVWRYGSTGASGRALKQPPKLYLDLYPIYTSSTVTHYTEVTKSRVFSP